MKQHYIRWTHEVKDPRAGGVTLRGRLVWTDPSKYKPHQGVREMERRRVGGFAWQKQSDMNIGR